jgi:hypothetical protein
VEQTRQSRQREVAERTDQVTVEDIRKEKREKKNEERK